MLDNMREAWDLYLLACALQAFAGLLICMAIDRYQVGRSTEPINIPRCVLIIAIILAVQVLLIPAEVMIIIAMVALAISVFLILALASQH
ncbi:MAG: hypothetical protein MK052_03795 [Alphaproteobacteria bacterium]|nr:hypothetical protein [Alphaproteobacteria bacterium]